MLRPHELARPQASSSLVCLRLFSAHAFAQAAGVPRTLAQINQALQAGEADKALGLIASLPQNGAHLAEAQNLECRVRYTLQQWDTAVARCEQAVKLDGQNSNDHLWLGRALGEKAIAPRS